MNDDGFDADPVPPYLTSDLPGCGGMLRREPEDFLVEEIPAYQPSGLGEHLFLWIQKRNVSAEQLTRHIARTLQIPASNIGVAGLKDRRAVTRQFVSVPARTEERLPTINTDEIVVLEARRHGNKLRSGHLRGNRFDILLRNTETSAIDSAQQIAERIARLGFPNYYGEQRFGSDGETLRLGLDLLTGRRTPRDLPGARRRFLLKLSLSAVQSELFNQALAKRLRDGLLHTVQQGDVMQVVASGGLFIVEDRMAEQCRFDAQETTITGPMFGPKMKRPSGLPAEREARILAQSGLTMDQFAQSPSLLSGTRRPYLIWPSDLQVTQEADGLRFRFTLPSGVYATTLLREFRKVGERVEG